MNVAAVIGMQLAQRAHPAHVLLVVHAVDHRAGAEEQQRLEERVGDHVEDRRDVGARADGQEHVAELADRRVGEHLLDVVLGDGDRRREQRGEHADEAISVGAQSYADARVIGLMRVIRNTPAVTIVAAWISADTGVGPSIASGSQRYSGSWALLPTAPTNSSSAIAVAVDCGERRLPRRPR